MVNTIDNRYYKKGVVQLMLPITGNCTFIGPNGIKFHSNDGSILINDYIKDPKAKLFPYHDTPVHKDNFGTFANQLFELNKQYLAIYSDGEKYQLMTDYFFQVDKKIYNNINVDLEFFPQESKKTSLEELKERLRKILLNNEFLYIINDDGELHCYEKEYIDFEIPLSGIVVFGDGKELKANVYKIKVDGKQIFIESSQINLQCAEQQDLENASFFPEPSIHKK